MKQYEFLNRTEYFATLARLARQARPGDRVMVAAMSFSPRSTAIADLVQALSEAARRGVKVTFIVDAITLLANDHGLPILSLSLHTLKLHNKYIAARHQAIKALQTAGVDCHIINMPKRRVGLVQQGRSHIKCAVVRDELFVGGCNLAKPEQIDVMVHWRDNGAADKLSTWLTRIIESGQTRDALGDVDTETALDPETDLLLDAGVPKQSIIFDEALTLIDHAQKWLFLTCQYFPGGNIAKHLAAAQARGVKVTIHFSHPRAHGRSAILHHVHQFTQRNRRLPKSLFDGRLDKQLPKLHAKVLISEKASLVGSHNYIEQGVNFGTAELALRSLDPEFARALRTFTENQINRITAPTSS